MPAALRSVGQAARSAAIAICAALVGAPGCGGDAERRTVRIELVRPDVPGACVPPADAIAVELYAMGDFVEVAAQAPAGEGIETELFPATTRALRLSVLGPGGSLRAVARSGTLVLGELGDGATIPMLLGPPRGFCQVGNMGQARRRPIVVRAGEGALVVGGLDDLGGPVAIAERYDPASGEMRLLADAPFDELSGGAGVQLADGRVLLVWEDGFQLFDPDSDQFGPPTVAQGVQVRNGAQVTRLADGRVLVAGGCAGDGALPPCAAVAAAQLWDPASGEFEVAPAPLAFARAGGAAWVDGDGKVVLAGGTGADGLPLAVIELWDPSGGGAALSVTQAAGAAAPLPAGGALIGFAPAAVAASAEARVVPALGGAGVQRTAVAPRAGATMTALDDGAVLVVGGGAAGSAEAELWVAAEQRFVSLADDTALGGRRSEHAAVRLDDGSVLIVGGADAGGASRRDAWVYRHDVTGPWSSVPVQIFASGGAPLVVAHDPAATSIEPADMTHPDRLVVAAGDLRDGPLGGFVVVAGPQFLEVRVSATVAARGGAALALLLGFTGAGDYQLLALESGQPAQLLRVAGAVPQSAACTGEAVPDLDEAGGAHVVTVERRGDRVIATVDGATVLDCDELAGARGLVGLGVLDATGALRVDAVEAAR